MTDPAIILAAPIIRGEEVRPGGPCPLVAYQDAVGVWTIGWGSTTQMDGTPIREGDTWTQEQADERFAAYLADDCAKVRDAITPPVVLPDQCIAALLSFSYNVGFEHFAASTLLGRINAGHPEQAPAQFGLWVHGTDPETGQEVTLAGLVKRRAAEAALFAAGLACQSQATAETT